MILYTENFIKILLNDSEINEYSNISELKKAEYKNLLHFYTLITKAEREIK